MTDVILEDYSKITIEKLKSTHDNNPFFHDIDINGDGSMEWKEFTQYIIDAVIGRNETE